MSSTSTMRMMPRFARLVSPEGQRTLRRSSLISVVSGVIKGAALVLLLPASVALSTHSASWGLGIAGWLWVFAGLAALGAIVDYYGAIVGYTTALDMLRTVYRRLGDRIAQLPLGWFRPSLSGRLSRLVSQEMLMLGSVLAHQLAPLITAVTSALVMMIGALVWDWRLGIVLAISVPVVAILLRIARRCLTHGKRISTPAEEELSSRIVEFAQCQGALRSAGRSSSFTELEDANAQALKAQRTDLWWGLLANLLNGVVAQSIIIALIVVAANLALGGKLGPLETIAFIGLALRFTQTLNEIGESTSGLEDRRVQLDQIDEILDAQPLPEPSDSASVSAASSPAARPGEVELADVGFGYRADTPVLRAVSLKVPAGGMCALVGPSGSGKTTIAKLIARFHDVDSGTVRVGGADVREQKVADLMAGESMVFQDVYLFDDTLEANIRIGREDATDEEVREAARLAGVTEIVDRLPDGWQTRVGEGGRALSGGERQRVSIARALLKDARVVLLDEATSSLDPENEANIVAAMERMRRTATLIVIAHKLNTIRSADQIVVLDPDGSVCQTGNHEELYGRPGRYRDYCLAREEAENWRLA
ncbi:MAG: ABC transporter ATP-binding protein/permease [Acidipropionibacterium sp.]|jgi:ATP-binding cassette subfamily B protein|nr:ABC transporter ATP-binding protein/permease [Acidipropionibacterium sp.]